MHCPLRMRANGYPRFALWSLAGRLTGLLLLLLLAGPLTFAGAPYVTLLSDSAPLAGSGVKGKQPGRMPPATRVLAVQAETDGNLVRLSIRADGLMVFRPFILSNPWRIVIDITGVRNAVSTPTIPVTSAAVSRIRVGQPEAGIVRVVLDTPAMIPYRVDLDGDRLLISVGNATPIADDMRPPLSAAAPTSVMARTDVRNSASPVAESQRPATSVQAQRPDDGNQDRTTINRLLRRLTNSKRESVS